LILSFLIFNTFYIIFYQKKNRRKVTLIYSYKNAKKRFLGLLLLNFISEKLYFEVFNLSNELIKEIACYSSKNIEQVKCYIFFQTTTKKNKFSKKQKIRVLK
ncbi:hypothetical protein ABG948_15560, partial [Enterococcus faecalis]